MNSKKLTVILCFSAIMAATSARASVIVSYAEGAGNLNSSVLDTQVLTFDSLSGKQTNLDWAGVGTVDAVYVKSADQYGGAAGSNYSVQSNSLGGSDHVSVTTLTLSTPSNYFGLWWSAGDPANVLQFYSGTTLEAQFVTSDLGTLPSIYKGNPNAGTFHGADSNEYFAFLNFYALPGATWDKIVFSNLGSSGFESDNWTSRVLAWGQDPNDVGNMPGIQALEITGTQVQDLTDTPEPSNAMAMLVVIVGGGLGAAGRAYRRSKN